MNMCRRLAIAFGCGILLAATSASMAVSAEQAATWSFGAGDHATYLSILRDA